jgi:pyrroline-5-carboxylate reductase
MLSNMRLLVIGGGNMGGALVRGAISKRVVAANDVGVVEVDDDRREAFARLGCRADASVAAAARDLVNSTQIVLAIKPQMFKSVAQSLLDARLTGSRIFISIMAGLESGRIHSALGPGARVVRCMPNTPCQIGAGMTAIALGMGAREGDEDFARRLFDALGTTIVLDESLMDAVTAVSGSGPAYVFLLAEAMQRAAEEIDLPPDVAHALVTKMIVGAAAMLDQKGGEAASLRTAVTSPGGTTAAALRVFNERGFEQAIIDAVRAARDRGRELGKT